MGRLRGLWVLVALLPLMAGTATFGFWGDHLMLPVQLPQVPDPHEELWLEEPLPEFTLGHVPARITEPPALGANPFLTAAENAIWSPRPVSLTRVDAALAAAPPTAAVSDLHWPQLQAVVSVDGKQVVLLGSSRARVGESTEGVEVIEVAGQRVLVEGEEGSKWLHLTTP